MPQRRQETPEAPIARSEGTHPYSTDDSDAGGLAELPSTVEASTVAPVGIWLGLRRVHVGNGVRGPEVGSVNRVILRRGTRGSTAN
jgi:hypothetical protein